jgi:hypothetical protein
MTIADYQPLSILAASVLVELDAVDHFILNGRV